MRLFLLSLLAVVFQFGCSANPAKLTPAQSHVVIITIDGFPSYLFNDPRTPIPTLRELARRGVVAADGMHVADPAITWPNHTTLVTGVKPDRHGVMFNGVLVRPGNGKPVRIDPARDQAGLVAVPTLFDRLHHAGLRTAAINWPCTRNSPSLDDNFPDVPEQVKYMTPRLRDELVADSVLTDPTDPAFKKLSSAGHDQVWTAAACKVIRERKPNFMLFHLLVVDGLHHNYGPKSSAGFAGIALADRHLRDILDALKDAGIRDQTSVFVVADHGFASASKLIEPNVLLRKEKLLTAGPASIVHADAMAVSEGGTALIYIDDRKTADATRARIVELFRGKEGIDRIIEPAEFAKMGLPTPAHSNQAPDLVLSGKDGYAFGNRATGEDYIMPIVMGRQNVGYHGLLADNPKMNALFIAAGRGIRKGVQLQTVQNVDVAPTAARLLGMEMTGIAGKVIEGVLTPDFVTVDDPHAR